MGRFAIKGLLSRKLRTALTAVAIVLGVAMISGTYVLTDSIDQAFDRVFGEIREASNAVITGRSAFDLSDGSGVTEPTFDDGLLEEVRGLPAVAAAEGSVDSDATQFIGDDGKAVVSGGAPNLGFSIANGDSQFNPLTLLEGSWPAASEVAIDKDTAADEGFEVGETIGVQAEGPVQRLRVSGIFQFSSGLSIGGATLAGFDLPTAQRLFDKVGKLDEIAIASKPDVPPAELVAQVEEILPPGTQVKTGEEQAQADAEETNEFISFLQTFLLAFAGIALFVGSFVIANSLSITIAQRTREFATLRTIGATNRQILGSVLVEALVVGTVASVVGPLPRASAREGPLPAVRRRRLHAAEHGSRLRAADDRRRARSRDPRDRPREHLPGLPRDDRPADRCRARGCCAPRRAARLRCAATELGALLTAIGAVVGAFAISTTPGNTLLSILLAVLGLLAMLFGCALFPSRTLGAVVSCGFGFAALLYGLFVPGLGTTGVLLWIGVGVLLAFFGVARVTTRLIPGLARADVADRALVGLRAERARLAVLHAAVLAAAPRGVGARRAAARGSARSCSVRSSIPSSCSSFS